MISNFKYTEQQTAAKVVTMYCSICVS